MKLLNFFSLITFVSFSCNPNIDFKETQQTSQSIKESKEKRVFISEYSIGSRKNFNNKTAFPIEQIWLENAWYLTLDKGGNQVFKVDTSKKVFVIRMNPNTDMSAFNFLKKWIIWDTDSSSTALIDSHISLLPRSESVRDSLFLTVYNLASAYNYKDNLKLIANCIAIRNYNY